MVEVVVEAAKGFAPPAPTFLSTMHLRATMRDLSVR